MDRPPYPPTPVLGYVLEARITYHTPALMRECVTHSHKIDTAYGSDRIPLPLVAVN